ncbi:MAG: TnpV protein [Ruminococcaceae bacterium]|nr:TnpV protein [Oscillospiraceae bacterium]
MAKLTTPEAVGLFGKMRVEYLRDEEMERYEELQNSGKLTEHMREVDEKAQKLYEVEVQKMLAIMEESPDWVSKSEKEKERYRETIRGVCIDIVCNDLIWV